MTFEKTPKEYKKEADEKIESLNKDLKRGSRNANNLDLIGDILACDYYTEGLYYGAFAGGEIGLIVGIFLAIFKVDFGVFSCIIAGAGGGFVLMLFRFAWFPLVYFLIRPFAKRMDSKNSEHNLQLKARIDQEIEEIQVDIEKYKSEYSNEARKGIANIPTAMIDDIVNCFSSEINETIKYKERSSNIESIEASLKFCVENYGVVFYSNFSSSLYDFNYHRCEHLQSFMLQTSLTLALAKRVEEYIRTTYEKDISGSDYKLEEKINYDDDEDRVYLVLKYTAPNGNYKPVQKWDSNNFDNEQAEKVEE